MSNLTKRREKNGGAKEPEKESSTSILEAKGLAAFGKKEKKKQRALELKRFSAKRSGGKRRRSAPLPRESITAGRL